VETIIEKVVYHERPTINRLKITEATKNDQKEIVALQQGFY
jgi:hypothetical protein